MLLQQGQSGAPPTPVVLPAETYEAQAAVSASGPGGPGSVVAETSGGLTINLIFDAAAMAAPASFRAGIEQAAALLSSAISDKITLNFNIDYSGTGGGAAAGPDSGQWVSYSTVRADLINNASPGDTSFNALPTASTIQGQSSVAVWNAQLKLWGLVGANDTTTDDGTATFATDIDPNLLVGVALHELTHAMGRVPYGPQPDVFDLYRFKSPGVRLLTDNIPASASYFSLDGGYTKIADYGRNSDPSDFLNSGVQGGSDPFNEYYSYGTLQQLTAIDLKQLDALGFHLASQTPVVIQTDGTTSLVQVGSGYFLDTVGSSSAGPQLKYNGSGVTAGEFGNWTPYGAIQVGSGYDVAWKNPGANQFTVWNTDSNGNLISFLVAAVPASNATLKSLETTFQQDLNGDGTIGLPAATILQTDGTTNLIKMGGYFFLNTVGSPNIGPELTYNGSPVAAGEFGTWVPYGAIQVAGGFDVAWKNAGANQYTVWETDSNGNLVAFLVSAVPGSNATLESLETTFHQDLNGDGSIGIIATVIQTDGTTSLAEIGSNYFLNTVGSSSTGPELTYGGAPVTAGAFGTWVPYGAIQVSGGFDVAWENPGANQYTVWHTDSNGNLVSFLVSAAPGNNATLEALETTFQQDLNGDGTFGILSTVVQTDGTTSLVEIGSNYFLNTVGSGVTGPELKYNGLPVTAGEFGTWVPYGAIQVSGGFDVAWKNPGANQYTVWSTDGSGNLQSFLVAAVPGSNAALQSLETIFHQDLNGDGTIGIPAGTSPAAAQPAQASQTSFDGQTLTLNTPSAFSGQLVGFGGDGTLTGSDQVDLRGFNFYTLHTGFNTASGTLSLSSGSSAASLQFLGQYSQDSFHFADDGNGGTLVAAAAPATLASVANEVSNFAAHDTFVFAPNFGNITLPGFAPATDTLQFSKTVFADVTALLAAAHDDGSGNAVITDALHDTITLQRVATAQLAAHQNDFHFV
ncbi:hypothetical protein AF336_28730 [Bradyrhizobium diazoefficiens]|nr:hypothetical protein AF336_28730 [Bradyrhizobium diazoefficiens]